jgi:predicted transposase YdaD
MMRLPDTLERRLWQEIRAIEEASEMPYVTSIERLAIERGRQEGQREGRREGRQEGEVHGRAALLASLLVKRFGPLPEAIQERLSQSTSEQLERWGERLLDAATLDAVFEDH